MTGRVTIRVSRHDPHNVELRSILDLTAPRAAVTTEVYLFLPKTMQLRSHGKEALLGDFRPRLRLAVPVPPEPARDEGGEPVLSAALDEIKRLASLALVGEEREAAGRIVAIVSSTLHHYGRRHRDEAFFGQSLLCRNSEGTLHRLTQSIEAIGRWINRVRAAVVDSPLGRAPVARLFDEYLSHLYVQYLGKVRKPEEAGAGGAEPTPVRDALDVMLARLQEAELAHRRAGGWDLRHGASPEEEERHLVRLSQLKKFFQSAMLVDVAPHEVNRRVAETASAAGAALAALWAAFFQSVGHAKLAGFGLSGAVLFGGIAAYVLKDRLKDWSKRFFNRKARQLLAEKRLLADIDEQLFVAEDEIGLAKVWLATGGAHNLTPEVQALRQAACLSEVEGALPEDTIVYRRYCDLHASASVRARFGKAWAVQDTIRINLERYLKNMDDAYKTVTRLSPEGKLVEAKYHRVYPFYVVVRSRHTVCRHPLGERWGKPPRPESRRGRSGATWWSPTRTDDRVYRIIVDKNGVDRIETVSAV